MRKPVSGAEATASTEIVAGSASSSSLLSPSDHGRQLTRLPELAIPSLLFSSTSTLPERMSDTDPALPTVESILPFGLYFRQIPATLPEMKTGQTTSEPEITTGDGNDPDKIDSIWVPDEDEESDEPPDDPPQKK